MLLVDGLDCKTRYLAAYNNLPSLMTAAAAAAAAETAAGAEWLAAWLSPLQD